MDLHKLCTVNKTEAVTCDFLGSVAMQSHRSLVSIIELLTQETDLQQNVMIIQHILLLIFMEFKVELRQTACPE